MNLNLPQIEVKITDLPAITSNMAEVKTYALKVKERYESLAITDDMIAEIKKEKALISKAEDQVATYRKNTVKAYKKPLEEFENNAKEAEKLLSGAYDACNLAVKRYEDNLKAEKQTEILTHFNHLKAKFELDFIKFEDCQIKIGLSDSLKSLKAQVEDFVNKISEEVKTINSLTLNKIEILTEYKNSLNLAQSIAVVNERQARIEAERKRLEEYQKQEEERQKALSEIQKQEEINQFKEEVYTKPIEIEEPKQVFTMKFTVKGTKEQLKALKDYMTERGIEYGN